MDVMNMFNKYRYENLIKYHQFYYSQFNIWMAFFTLINGGLLVAYCSKSLNSFQEKVLIILFGYIASFLFHCCAKSYRFFLANSFMLIHDHEDRNVQCDYDRIYSCLIVSNKHYFHPLKGANISIQKIITLFSFLLTYAWGFLLVSSICKNIKSFYLFSSLCKCENICLSSIVIYRIILFIFSIIFITGINMFFLMLTKKHLITDNTDKHVLLKPKSIVKQE